MTPTVMPITEISEISEIKPCRCLARKYLRLINHSYISAVVRQLVSGLVFLHLFFRLHMREKDDVSDRGRIGQQHDQPVNPYPLSSGRRHTILQGTYIIDI